jgi:hypothetical protein
MSSVYNTPAMVKDELTIVLYRSLDGDFNSFHIFGAL